MPRTGSNSSNKQPVSFAEELSVHSYTDEEASDDEKDPSSEVGAEAEPGPSAADEPVGAPRRKRGRPADTPLQKAEKAMKRAETLKKEAKSALFKERDEFKKGAMWDKPSEAQRVKQRILGHVDKVLDLQNAYEKAREAWVQARIDDAVQRALKLERLYAAQAYLMYDQRVLLERNIGLLRAEGLLAEHVRNS